MFSSDPDDERISLFVSIFENFPFWKFLEVETTNYSFFFFYKFWKFHFSLFSSFLFNQTNYLLYVLFFKEQSQFRSSKDIQFDIFLRQTNIKAKTMFGFFLVFVRFDVSVEIDKKILLIKTSSWREQSGKRWYDLNFFSLFNSIK